jgi:hypothetical protein
VEAQLVEALKQKKQELLDELDILNKNMQSDLELIRETNRKLEKVLF